MTNEKFKKTLWCATNKLRGSVSGAEYKRPAPRASYDQTSHADRMSAIVGRLLLN